MKNTVHICIAADRNYKLPLMCLLNSIYKHSNSTPCTVHILYSGLSNRYRNKLYKTYNKTCILLDFIDMSGIEFDFHGLDMQHWTNAIFYRIMIPVLFPHLDRILYIDGDTLVLDDLSELFELEIPENMDIAMVVDRFSWKTRMLQLKTMNYYNSGVILFDLNKCRHNNFSDKCVKWLYNNQDKATYPDQDAINSVCDGNILRINNIYNKQFAPNDTIALSKKPVIMHFLSAIKPWMWKAPIKYSRIYRQYIPSKVRQYCIVGLQIIWSSKYFCLHKKRSTILCKSKVAEQIKYYVFNICVHTKTITKSETDLINFIRNNRK